VFSQLIYCGDAQIKELSSFETTKYYGYEFDSHRSGLIEILE